MTALTYTGQIALIPGGSSWIAQGIELVTASDVCHVIIGIDEEYCIGAEPGGAKIRPISYWDTAVWSRFEFSEAQALACASWARAREGRPYNFIDDALIGIEDLSHLQLPEWFMKGYSTDTSYECAQLADAALSFGAGISVFNDGRLPGQVAPGSFEPFFKERGWWHDYRAVTTN